MYDNKGHAEEEEEEELCEMFVDGARCRKPKFLLTNDGVNKCKSCDLSLLKKQNARDATANNIASRKRTTGETPCQARNNTRSSSSSSSSSSLGVLCGALPTSCIDGAWVCRHCDVEAVPMMDILNNNSEKESLPAPALPARSLRSR